MKDGTAVTGIALRGDRWQVSTAQGGFEAAYLVAADGAQGPMAKWLGFPDLALRTATVLELPTDSPVAADFPISFEFGLVKQGCLWNFPKQQGYSIGAANFWAKPKATTKQP